MESIASLYTEALALSEMLPRLVFGKVRIRKSRQFKESLFERTVAKLQECPSLAESFEHEELAEMLAETCLEMASFLFSAGARAIDWRCWCSISGVLFGVAGSPGIAIQLLTVSRVGPDDARLAALRTAQVSGYRDQAVQYIVFGSVGAEPPTTPRGSPDEHYDSIIRGLANDDVALVIKGIERVVEFWLDETSYGEFEPGVFPVFEPEINATVAALIMQGFPIAFRKKRVRAFLKAGLEEYEPRSGKVGSC